MANMENSVPVARKVLPIIYVLDTSGSMTGEGIATVNEAIFETLEVLKEVSNHNTNAEIKIGVLTFATNAGWVGDGLTYVNDFWMNELTAGGTTEVAAALTALNEKLSRSEYLVSNTGFCVPVIIFMSDGAPTDPGIWEKKLEWVMNNNKWFRTATKIAIAIGDDADKGCLAKLVGSPESVIEAKDFETLKALIKVVSVTSSMINGNSRTMAEGSSAAEIIRQTIHQIDNPDSIQVGTDEPDPNWKAWDQNSSAAAQDSSSAVDGGWSEDDDIWN